MARGSTEVVPATAPLPGGEGIAAGELHLAEPEWFSLRVDQPTDPYRLLLATLGDLGSGGAGVVQVLARPAGSRRRRRCRRAAIALRSGRPRSKLVRFVWMTKGVPARPNLSADPMRAADVRAATEKAAAICFEATVRYGVVGPARGHAARQALKAEGHGIAGALAMFDGRNRLTRRHLARPYRSLCARRFGRADLYTVGELAALAHLPTDRTVAGLSRAGAHAVAPPPEVRSDGKVLGRAEGGGRGSVGLSVADARQHVHILGATGSGKSTLLTNLILQDVAARRGAVVIDPKGDLIDDILDRLPEGSAGRVVILDPEMVCATGWAPLVCFWFPSPRREAEARRVLGHPEVTVATGAAGLGTGMCGNGGGAVWLPVGSIGPRRHLIDLAAGTVVSGRRS